MRIVTGGGSRLLPALAASAVLLCALPPASDAGDIKFSVAQDYPSSTVTYNGTASPGAITHLYRDGQADKNADLVIGNIGGGPVVLYGRGGGRFSPERHVINNSDTDASAVQVADFNADGIPDIVSGGYTTLQITVMLGRPDGSFGVSGHYPLRGVWPSQFQVADLNRDGHLDIATSSYGGGNITILLGKGDGTFRQAPPVPSTNLALALKVADFDGDAIPDMAVTESIPTVGTPPAPGTAAAGLLHGSVHVLLGNGDATFRPAASYPVGALSELIRYGDVDEDGSGDLFVFNAIVSNDASILFGLRRGRFEAEQRMRLGGPGSVSVLDVDTADGSEGLQLIDFNGDGHLDMAVTQMISSRLLIFEGDGRGNFTPAGFYNTTGFPEDLMAGDLNGDGCSDLAVPGNVPPIGPTDVGIARVSVLLNLSPGCQKRRTFGRHPKKRTRSRTATFEFSSADPVATFRCKIDQKAFKPCGSPARFRKLKRGKHTLRLVATDTNGNAGAPSIFRWRVVEEIEQ
ncbi:MAG: hypothetical protein QOG62_2357 [Thermoleophilaceae bacterium]|nr:hypothetical protein [Thermoleophilaceae bacterium]